MAALLASPQYDAVVTVAGSSALADPGLLADAAAASLAGTDKPLLITSGTGLGQAAPAQPTLETVFDVDNINPRKASEEAGAALLAAGVKVVVVRLPQVHDPVKQGLISPLIEIARAKGVSAYVGDGRNRWPAAHVLDVARLYRLALERGRAGARFHAVAEEGVARGASWAGARPAPG